MKTILLILALAASAIAAPPTPITATDVPNSVTANISATLKVGIVSAYNQWALAEYNALTTAQKATYTGPSKNVSQYILDRVGDVFKSYTKVAFDADLAAQKATEKWPSLTQPQRDQIKAIFATVP